MQGHGLAVDEVDLQCGWLNGADDTLGAVGVLLAPGLNTLKPAGLGHSDSKSWFNSCG